MLISISQAILICIALMTTVLSVPQQYEGSDCRTYLIEIDQKYNWYQAWHECARRNMELVSIASEEKNNVIIEMLKKHIGHSENLWLAGNDEYSSREDLARPIYWSTTGQKFNFTHWSHCNPNNEGGAEHCIHIWDVESEYKWNDIECTTLMGFICEPNHHLEDNENNVPKYKPDAFAESKSGVQQQREATETAIQTILNEQKLKVKIYADQIQLTILDLLYEVKCIAERVTNDLDTFNIKDHEICAS